MDRFTSEEKGLIYVAVNEYLKADMKSRDFFTERLNVCEEEEIARLEECIKDCEERIKNAKNVLKKLWL